MMKGTTAKELLEKMEEDQSYREVDWARIQEQHESWPECSICGQRYTPSRSSKPSQCSDVVRHAGLLRGSQPKPVGYCSFCNAALPGNSRKSRMFCNANCRNGYAYHVNKDKSKQGSAGEDTHFYAKSKEGVKT